MGAWTASCFSSLVSLSSRTFISWDLFFPVPGIELWDLQVLSKWSTTKLQPQPFLVLSTLSHNSTELPRSALDLQSSSLGLPNSLDYNQTWLWDFISKTDPAITHTRGLPIFLGHMGCVRKEGWWEALCRGVCLKQEEDEQRVLWLLLLWCNVWTG